MALPLPQVVADVGPGGQIVTALRGLNALKGDIYGNQIKQQEAKYAPYQAYGNAFLTNQQAQWLPYQYQMQALSNPLLWMAAQNNPALQKQLSSMMTNPMQGGGGVSNIPQPSQTSNGLMSMIVQPILSKLGIGNSNAMTQGQGGGDSQNAMMPMPGTDNSSGQTPMGMGGSPNPLVPATGGSGAAVTGKMTAPYNTQVVDPGKLIYDPNTGKMISAPTNQFVENAQIANNAAQRVAPQLERLSVAAGPFMSAGGQIGNQVERGWNLLFPSHPGKLPTQYAEFKSLLQSSPESLVKAYGLNPTNETIERMQKVIEPYMGETQGQYKQRILNELESIRQGQSISAKQVAEGFNVSGGNESSEEPKKSQPTSENQETGFDPTKILNYKFNTKEEFQNAFDALDKDAQNLVIKEMKRRGMK